jgi:tRNA threonylcarbamoyl adenosine modification protein (Sua5/YciO/YrdC/YwlC family)
LRLSEEDIILTVDAPYPARKIVRQAVEVLKAGGVIAYPTDTTYGLGCDIFNKEAIERVYRLKKMTKQKPLSFVCSDLKDIARYAQVSNYAYQVMRKLLPGAYTFVLLATKMVPKMMLTKRKTVGIRVPNNDICLSLVAELGHPIISTSAQVEDEEILSNPTDIERKFGHGLDLIIDNGPLVSQPSSMIDLTSDTPVILREGIGDTSMFR